MAKNIGTIRGALLAATVAGALLCFPAGALGAAVAGDTAAQQSAALAQHIRARLNKSQYKNVQASVDGDGVATLTGSVNLAADKLRAAGIARHTQGVKAVKDEIDVAGPDIPDAQLQQKLDKELAYSRVGYGNIFDAIMLRMQNGVAMLDGHAHDYANRDAAVALVASTPGVKGVEDRIQVDPASPMDWRIRHEEARAIYGFPSLNKYALNPVKPIRISVQNGHVELYGVVDSKMDKQIAEMQANQVPGVFSVKNYLQVAGQPGSENQPG